MKILLILVAASFFVGCANSSIPKFPDTIKDHYLVEVRDEEMPARILTAIENIQDISPMAKTEVVRCLHFNIESLRPYKIKFTGIVPIKDCNMVGGYKPKDTQSLLNWIDDVYLWSETKKKCFR